MAGWAVPRITHSIAPGGAPNGAGRWLVADVRLTGPDGNFGTCPAWAVVRDMTYQLTPTKVDRNDSLS
jgi:hypothetical protein